MKKAFGFFTILLFVSTMAFGMSKEEVLYGHSEESENCRVELDISDCVFTNFITAGNMTSINLKISFADNEVGIIAGILLRETAFNLRGDTNWTFTFNPIAGMMFNNNEILAGCLLYDNDNDGTIDISPYVSFAHLFNFLPLKSGFSNSSAFKVGMDWYINYNQKSESALTAIGDIFISAVVPKFFAGFTYQLGYSWPKNRTASATESAIPAPVAEEFSPVSIPAIETPLQSEIIQDPQPQAEDPVDSDDIKPEEIETSIQEAPAETIDITETPASEEPVQETLPDQAEE